VTYDQWKTTDPAELYAAVCERCGGWLRGLYRDECGDCADELLADEALMDFYQWEPEAEAPKSPPVIELTGEREEPRT
jgi:hypothetical protein